MNPLDIACMAASAGCGAGLARLLDLVRAAQDAEHEVGPQDEIVTGWKAMAVEISDELTERQKIRDRRADALRLKYLEDRGEVLA